MEAIAAPDYDEALAILKTKKNLRLMKVKAAADCWSSSRQWRLSGANTGHAPTDRAARVKTAACQLKPNGRRSSSPESRQTRGRMRLFMRARGKRWAWEPAR